MNKHSVIFIEQAGVEYERLNHPERSHANRNKLMSYFLVAPQELPNRIVTAFLPPVLGGKSQKVYTDLTGPLLAAVLLVLLLHYGHANKHPSALAPLSPSLALLYYLLIVPSVSLFFAKLGRANLSPHKILSLLGYGLYGHLLTVATSLLFDREVSNTFFFTVMVLFGGLSCLRIVIVLLLTIPKPGARLLICSLVSVFHLLFIIFIHFSYMHRTFVYGKKL